MLLKHKFIFCVTIIPVIFLHPGSPVRGIDSTFGPGSGPITLDNVVCAGTEDDLLSCSHKQIFQHNCDHSEDVAVVCDGEPIL